MDVQISVGENGFEQIPSPIHRYRAKGSAGNVWVRPSAIGFETTQYVDFETLSEDVKLLLDAAKPILDSDFFTRIGLRYVNVLPPDASEPSGWVNSKVLGSMGDEALGPLDVHWTQMQGRTDCGQFVFKYGIANIANQGRRYMLDADFFDEGVEWDEAIARLRRFNELNFQLYSWAIGPKTLEWLGKAEPK